MDNFQLEKAAIYRAVLLDKIPFFRYSEIIKDLFFAGALLFSLLNLTNLFLNLVFPFFELAVLFLSFYFLFLQIHLFFEYKVKKPTLLINVNDALKNSKSINFADFLDFESAKIVYSAQKKGGVDSYLLLFSLLENAREMDFSFYRILLDKKQAMIDLRNIFEKREVVKERDFSDCFYNSLKDALFYAQKRGTSFIKTEDLFVALSKNNRYLQEVLYRAGIKTEDVFSLTQWQLRIKEKENPWLYKNLIKKGRLGVEWVSGYTAFLDNFSIDWTKAMKFAGFPEIVGHKKEISSLERVLSRNEVNSALLVGEPGTGRKSVVQEIVKKSFLGEGLPEINYKRFLEIDLAAVFSFTQKKEELEEVIDKIFTQAIKGGDVILVINDIHSLVGYEGSSNITRIIESYLHIPSFRVVGITSNEGYRQNIESNPSLAYLFEKIEVEETSKEDTLILLQRIALYFERKYKKIISYAALKKVITLSERYIRNHPFPEKATDLLEESVIHINQKKEPFLLPMHIEKIISERTEVPVGEINKEERDTLLNMEKLLCGRVVGQEEAVKAVSFALRRSRADIDVRKGLVGSFLFLGPTGVGKTEMAKAITDIYYGSEKKINRVDMSEFQSISDISRLIGSPNTEGILTVKVKEDPFSLILLDEIEKAHPDILNLFLQILDEGHLTDGKGEKIDFQNSMLIATSNAGYQTIINSVESKKDWKDVKNKVLQSIFQQSVFRPEFVNRFDDVVLFRPLSKSNLEEVVGLQLEKMRNNLKERDLDFKITEELKKEIAELGYDPVFGAREIQRIIQNKVGDALSSALLRNEIKKGETITINPKTFILEKE